MNFCGLRIDDEDSLVGRYLDWVVVTVELLAISKQVFVSICRTIQPKGDLVSTPGPPESDIAAIESQCLAKPVELGFNFARNGIADTNQGC